MISKPPSEMTDEEVVSEMQKDTPLNRARREFSYANARIERIRNPVKVRRIEFETVVKIAIILGADPLADQTP